MEPRQEKFLNGFIVLQLLSIYLFICEPRCFCAPVLVFIYCLCIRVIEDTHAGVCMHVCVFVLACVFLRGWKQ